MCVGCPLLLSQTIFISVQLVMITMPMVFTPTRPLAVRLQKAYFLYSRWVIYDGMISNLLITDQKHHKCLLQVEQEVSRMI